MHWIYAHLLGDFILQNDWMALNKKKRGGPCLVHVLVYMVPFLLCGLSPFQMGLIALQHYLQDRTGFVVWFMKIKGSEEFTKGPCAPWSLIVTDNIIHILWIQWVCTINL